VIGLALHASAAVAPPRLSGVTLYSYKRETLVDLKVRCGAVYEQPGGPRRLEEGLRSGSHSLSPPSTVFSMWNQVQQRERLTHPPVACPHRTRGALCVRRWRCFPLTTREWWSARSWRPPPSSWAWWAATATGRPSRNGSHKRWGIRLITNLCHHVVLESR
jgi:hypothetical protein